MKKGMKRTLINNLSLLGVISLISYTAAVFFSPFAHKGDDWIAQAFRDLSAANASPRVLWNQLSNLIVFVELFLS